MNLISRFKFICMIIPLFAFAGTVRADTPEATVRVSFEQVRERGMSSIASMMHPEELAKFQQMMAPVVDLAFSEEEGRDVFSVFADKADPAKPGEMSPEEFMSAFFELLERMQPMLSEIMKNAQWEVIGHVKEGDASHVVTRFRVNIQGLEFEKMDVVSTRKHDGVEKLMLSGEVKQLAETLKRAIAESQL